MAEEGGQDREDGRAPVFDAAFRARLELLFQWRRDVRRFRPDPMPAGLLEELLRQVALAPSVGYSQPWRFVAVDDPARRRAVRTDFLRCNEAALADYHGERAKLYAGLKLEGLDQAPVHLAVFTDHGTETGHGLGSRTMPETLDYSTVMAVFTLWLAARTHGIGMGWVSILDPAEVARILEVPAGWALTAYLCLGYPRAEDDTPALARAGWERRDEAAARLIRR
jgi:5,6-dimethylbenzimidazole synthase